MMMNEYEIINLSCILDKIVQTSTLVLDSSLIEIAAFLIKEFCFVTIDLAELSR